MQLRSFQDEKFLAKMQAFKDEEGLLRIRTKLVDSDEKEDFKFPVLLPANDVVVKLIREEHKKAMHAGSYILLARLRENFWIIKAKNKIKVTGESKSSKRGTAHEDRTQHTRERRPALRQAEADGKAKKTKENPRHEIHRKASKTEDRFSGAPEGERGETPRRPARPSAVQQSIRQGT
ncbi:integrase_H2C2 domain-containing protein [Nephila pilipes]|uniref:Integrase_H2C2 domain-containing protein n=1 Tax=Nephila pilipes TaxID=299642 RepID=A0A8X6TE24_NEPPI|nr:integrase_H2C2 domain-containing protein [Nephila pilipes]